MTTSTQFVIVPSMNQFVRDSTDLGPTGALISKLRKLKFTQALRLFKLQSPYLLPLLKRNFAAAILLLIDIELVSQTAPLIILSSQITDLSLALNNQSFFTKFINHIHNRHHLKVGLETSNPDILIPTLGHWRLSPDAILTTSKLPPHRRRA